MMTLRFDRFRLSFWYGWADHWFLLILLILERIFTLHQRVELRSVDGLNFEQCIGDKGQLFPMFIKETMTVLVCLINHPMNLAINDLSHLITIVAIFTDGATQEQYGVAITIAQVSW